MDISARVLLTIALPEIRPPVWREIIVPTDIPLDRLHDVFQIAMGWQDCHLYEFTIGDRRFSEDPDDGEPSGAVRLGEVLAEANGVFAYTYDFGDGWQHLVKVSEPKPEDDDAQFGVVVCVGGKRACPPENIGGPPGYEEFCEAIKDKRHPDHQDMKQWYADATGAATPFKPEAFDPERVNCELRKYLRWNRPRPLIWAY
jgi:hypothetical protein